MDNLINVEELQNQLRIIENHVAPVMSLTQKDKDAIVGKYGFYTMIQMAAVIGKSRQAVYGHPDLYDRIFFFGQQYYRIKNLSQSRVFDVLRKIGFSPYSINELRRADTKVRIIDGENVNIEFFDKHEDKQISFICDIREILVY